MLFRKLGVDDWFMLAGMAVTGGYLFETLYGLRWGTGLPTTDDTLENQTEILKVLPKVWMRIAHER